MSFKKLGRQLFHLCLPLISCISGNSGDFPSSSVVKIRLQCRRHRACKFYPWVRKIPWRRAWQPSPVSLPGEPHGQRGLAGCSPQGCKESDMTEATEHARACTCNLSFSRILISTALVKRKQFFHLWRLSKIMNIK